MEEIRVFGEMVQKYKKHKTGQYLKSRRLKAEL